jgi:hypothetical protein
MIIRLPDTAENEVLMRRLLCGYFEFADEEGAEFPLATISVSGSFVVADANEGEYPQREIQCLYRDLVFSALPPGSWEPKYPEYIGTWDERGIIQ